MNVALHPVRVLSLFSGGGGLDLGFHAATGGRSRTVCYVEREAYAAACLVARMEEAALDAAPVWDDVATFDGRAWRGAVDCVLGGSPCQDLSVAGKRAGIHGERSGLFWHQLRIAVECEAPIFAWENVGGATGALAVVESALAEAGYRGASVSIRASDVGAPHRRQRIFLLAYRNTAGRTVLDATQHDGGGWVRVRFSADCDDDGSCPECEIDFADCECVGPTQDGFEYEERDGELWARPVGHAEGCGVERHGSGRKQVAFTSTESPLPRRAGFVFPPAPDDAEPRARPVGDTDEGSSRRRSDIEKRRSEGRTFVEWTGAQFPPAPNDADGWRDYLDAGGPAPAESRLRRGVDGMACGCLDAVWADRLRLLGNGVVPQQAEAAFRFLIQRLEMT